MVLSEADGFIAVDTIVAHIWFGEVENAGDEKEVLYCFEIAVGGFKSLIVKPVVTQDIDSSYEIFSPHRKCSRDTFLLLHDLQ